MNYATIEKGLLVIIYAFEKLWTNRKAPTWIERFKKTILSTSWRKCLLRIWLLDSTLRRITRSNKREVLVLLTKLWRGSIWWSLNRIPRKENRKHDPMEQIMATPKRQSSLENVSTAARWDTSLWTVGYRRKITWLRPILLWVWISPWKMWLSLNFVQLSVRLTWWNWIRSSSGWILKLTTIYAAIRNHVLSLLWMRKEKSCTWAMVLLWQSREME